MSKIGVEFISGMIFFYALISLNLYLDDAVGIGDTGISDKSK